MCLSIILSNFIFLALFYMRTMKLLYSIRKICLFTYFS